MKRLIPYLMVASTLACNKPTPPEPADSFEDGILVLNEGLYQQNNASISFYSILESKEYQQVFLTENGRGLGDTANDFEEFELNGTNYVIVAVDVSSQLEIFEAQTLQSIAQIPILDGTEARSPRQVIVEGTKAYCCNFDGTVSVIDLTKNQLSNTISVGKNPDGLEIRDGKLYVANSGGLDAPNYDSTITVIDLSSESVIETIDCRINLGEITQDDEGDLYVHSKGNYSDVSPAFVKLNAANIIEGVFERNFSAWTYSEGYIYFVDTELNGIYRFNTMTDEFEADQLIDCSAYDIPYSITIVNDFIYVTDAHGYVNSSTVHCYNISGVKQYSFTAGLNANEIIVNE